ncbi:hypothetical protein BDB00DRAFT_862861 [Zychaea mexicana]|uniref:uncharacterized protein n=1 Tax=Zychaea mexicana TaxID=64656 RepID=UPI0022FEA817|nr:uncharacterized protein BDB00DRAFT_862861 [Zychaea mexicana]KAI9470420.1 hypothetical protein BDB00DRAFT_862861 [Zychaea mexicana]
MMQKKPNWGSIALDALKIKNLPSFRPSASSLASAGLDENSAQSDSNSSTNTAAPVTEAFFGCCCGRCDVGIWPHLYSGAVSLSIHHQH